MSNADYGREALTRLATDLAAGGNLEGALEVVGEMNAPEDRGGGPEGDHGRLRPARGEPAGSMTIGPTRDDACAHGAPLEFLPQSRTMRAHGDRTARAAGLMVARPSSPNIGRRRANPLLCHLPAMPAGGGECLISPGSGNLMPAIFALSSMATILIVPLVVAVVLVIFAIGLYNSLVTLRNRYKNAFSQIDVQLKRRYDLIPNLVETAKGYMRHERETLEAVINARNSALAASQRVAANPGDPAAMSGLNLAESQLSAALGRLFALAEAYPDLKANQNMLALQEELTSTENKVAFARQAFNDAVTSYNTGIEKFPNNLVAGMIGFAPAQLFETESPKEREAPGGVLIVRVMAAGDRVNPNPRWTSSSTRRRPGDRPAS